MNTLLHSAEARNSTLNILPLDLVDDFDFDLPTPFDHYEPTDEEVAQLNALPPILPLAGEPYPFTAWLDDQASYYRSKDSETAHWLAAKLERLAGDARFMQAKSPADFDAREEVLMESGPFASAEAKDYRVERYTDHRGVSHWGIYDQTGLVDWYNTVGAALDRVKFFAGPNA